MKVPYIKMPDGKCVAAVVVVPEKQFNKKFGESLVIMIAWEWESMAKLGHFKCYKDFGRTINQDTIDDVADYGKRMTDEEIKKWFPFLVGSQQSTVDR